MKAPEPMAQVSPFRTDFGVTEASRPEPAEETVIGAPPEVSERVKVEPETPTT